MNIKDTLFSIGCVLIALCMFSYQVETNRSIIKKHQIELDSIKLENENIRKSKELLIDSIINKSDFIYKVYNIYKPLRKEAGILPSFLVATAILESNHGESNLTKQSNNLFCIKGSYNGNFVLAKDDEIGLSKFRKYESYEESIKDYIRLMSTSRYCEITESKDFVFCANFVKSKGYASNPHYSTKIIEIIKNYDLEILDII